MTNNQHKAMLLLDELDRGNYKHSTVEDHRGNYNNINNTNNTNNEKQHLRFRSKTKQTMCAIAPPSEETSSSSQERASHEAKGVLEQAAPWRYLKADLFDNATDGKRKFKVNLAFLLHEDTEFQRASALLNSEFRHAISGLDTSIPEQAEHKDIMRELYQTVNQNTIRKVKASKCYTKAPQGGKGHTIPGLSVMLEPLDGDGEYRLYIIVGTKIYTVELNSKGLTDKQRKARLISSGEQGECKTSRITVDEFFKLPPQG